MMRKARLLLALAVPTAFVLACNKSSSSAGGAAEDTGAPAAEASASAPPAAEASAPPSVLSSLMGFEGEVSLLAKSAEPSKPQQTIDMMIKGDRIRLDALPGSDTANTFGGKSYLIVRAADKKLDIITDAKKQVVELDLSNPDNVKNIAKGGPPGKPGHDEPPPKVAKTGTKETIAGYPCEDWEITGAKDGKKKGSLCVAELTSSFFHIPLQGLPGEYGFVGELTDGHHFPLRIVSYDNNQAESNRLEVTKIDQHPMDQAKFDLPPGYTTIDMLQLVKGLTAQHPSVPGMPSNLPMPPPHKGKHH